MWIWPGDLGAVAGLGLTVSWLFLVAAIFPAVAPPGSSWSARSRVAARTNELGAGKRRRIIGSEEEAPAGLPG
jgi:hypothetical protein